MKIVPPCANAGQLSNDFALAKAAFEAGDIHEGSARRLLALRPRKNQLWGRAVLCRMIRRKHEHSASHVREVGEFGGPHYGRETVSFQMAARLPTPMSIFSTYVTWPGDPLP